VARKVNDQGIPYVDIGASNVTVEGSLEFPPGPMAVSSTSLDNTATNTSNTASNTSAISTNTSTIATHASTTATNTGSVAANTAAVAISTDAIDATTGATTDAAVVTDANGSISAKLRGLVKWAFERMPASLGQKTKAASLPVVIASDQGALQVTTEVFTTGAQSAITIGTSALLLPAAPLASRKVLHVQNRGPASIYVGPTSGVTTANGTEVEAGASLEWDHGEVSLYAISSSAGNDVRLIERA
jgi:hypothetical protein